MSSQKRAAVEEVVLAAPGGDVYRYDIGNDVLECLTCLAPGLDGEVVFSTQRA